MIYQFNNFIIDSTNFILTLKGQKLEVEPRVFDLILYLVKNHERLVSRDELFNNVWSGRNVLDATLSNHIKIARSVLGDNGQSQHTIKTIHGRGYQFIAELNQNDSKDDKKTKSFKLFYKYYAMAFVLFLIILTAVNTDFKKDNQTTKIAVLPFINTQPNPESDYFGFAVADQIIGDLSYLHNITVRSSASIRKYNSMATDPVIAGQELDVDFVLTGNYLKVDDTIRLSMELIEVDSEKLFWRSKQIELKNQNTFELQDIVAQKVIDGLKLKFSSSEINRIQKDVSNNPLAYEYYLRSIAYPYTTDGNKLAIKMAQKALELDSEYAPIYVQLGDRIRRVKQFSLEQLPLINAQDYYLKALEINPELLSALSYLALYYTETNRIDEAIKLAKKMIEINPNNANTHFTLGYIYRYTGMVDAAIQEMEKAVSLDSHNPKYRSLIGTYSNNGNYHKALRMTDLYKKSPFTLGWKGLLERRLGNNEKALNYFKQVIELDKDGLWANVATVFTSFIQGKPEAGLKAVENLVNSAENDGETLYYLSSYYGLLGDKQNCLLTLEKAINAGFYNYPFMASNSYFDGVANDTRFKELLIMAKNKHLDFKEMYF